MASGVPVIVSRRGGNAEFLTHGEEALLFDTDDDAFDLIMRLRSDPDYGTGSAVMLAERWNISTCWSGLSNCAGITAREAVTCSCFRRIPIGRIQNEGLTNREEHTKTAASV